MPHNTIAIDRTVFLLAGLLAMLAFLLYSNTWFHDFAYDDFSIIKSNRITQLGWKGIGTIWQEHYRFGFGNSPPELYRPVSLTLFALEWGISPDNPSLHHLINILCYVLTAGVLFFTLLKLMPQQLLLAFLGTAFFIAHPIHTEVVANIKSRDEILTLLFFLGALNIFWKYLETTRKRDLVIAVLLYGVALFSKENAITFIALFPLCLYFFRPNSWRKEMSKIIPFLLPILIFMGLRYQAIGGFGYEKTVDPLDNFLIDLATPVQQLATAIQLLGLYLWRLFFPLTLVHEYGFNQIPPANFSNWQVIVSLLIHLFLGIWAIIKLPKRHFLAFCIFFYLITLSISSNVFVLIGISFGERLLYTPSLAFALAIAYLLSQLNQIKSETNFLKKNKTILLIGLVLIGIYAVKTVDRNRAWKNNYTLFTTDLKIAPNSAKLNYHLALEYYKKGVEAVNPEAQKDYWQKAMSSFEKAIQIAPNYSKAYDQLGLTYFRMGDNGKAMTAYEKAIQYDVENAFAYNNMGIIFLQNKAFQNALAVYQKAIELDPTFVDARRNLGAVFAQMGDFQKAIEQFKIALAYVPFDATINYYLGNAYKDAGDPKSGEIYLEKAFELNPAYQNK